MNASTIGLDMAKNVFQAHGVDTEGEVVIRRQLRRSQVIAFFKKLPPCLVGLEACATSHYWAREIEKLGHDGSPDAGGLREALRQAQQERRGGCGSDLRGGDAAADAVRRDQDARAARGADAASNARTSGRSAHH